MIHFGKSSPTVKETAEQLNSAVESRLEELDRYEKEVGQWIKQNPILGIGIALVVGVGMGLILKRRG